MNFGKKKVFRARDGNEWEEQALPDSYKPRGLCPRCGLQSNFEVTGHIDISYDPTMLVNGHLMQAERVSGLVCRGCSAGMAVLEEKCHHHTRPGSGDVIWRGVFAWPIASARLSSDVPEDIADTFSEAETAVQIGLSRAAAILARATLEAITLDKGEKSGDPLIKRIENLKQRGVLQSDLADWAHEIRILGNAGAHDPTKSVPLADVTQLLDFIRNLVKYLYEMPAELNRRRAKTP